MGFWNAFWPMFWIGLIFIPLLCVWMCSIFSVFTREMSGWLKALWLVAIIFLPFIGTLLYLIVSPGKRGMSESWWSGDGNWLAWGEYNRPVVPEEDQPGPVRVAAARPVDELQMLTQLHDAGKLTDAEFASAKARFAAPAAAGPDATAA